MTLILRRLRGASGNALVWAAAWFGTGLLFITAINVLHLGIFRQYARFSLSVALEWAAEMAVAGFVTGGAFSLYVAAAFRGRRLPDLSPARFALAGGLVAVLLSFGELGLLGVLRLGVLPVLRGVGPFHLQYLLWPILLPAAFGSVTSYASIKMAQRALPAASAAAGRLRTSENNLRAGSGTDPGTPAPKACPGGSSSWSPGS